ncbi:MAG: glycosyltransferase [Candidatus Nitrosopumilus sp. bin_7KS]
MNKVVMTTGYSLNQSNGSVVRVKREVEALKRNNFANISIIDEFNENMSKPKNCLIHAQQLTGRFFDEKSYIADAHGIAAFETRAKTREFPIHSWKKWGYFVKSYQLKKLEEKIWRNSLHVICASDAIFDRVKNIQSATVVRPAVKVEEFIPTTCQKLRIAVVGPFLPGTQNYDWKLISYCVQKLKDIEFVFIGISDKFFRNQLNFSNAKFLGRVDNYVESLSSCSVLLSPYPESSHIIGSKTKMLEAGACKMPVITTPTGALGMPEDLLIVSSSKEDFVKKLEYLKDEKIRESYGEKFQKEVKLKYDTDIEIKKLIKVYKEFLK